MKSLVIKIILFLSFFTLNLKAQSVSKTPSDTTAVAKKAQVPVMSFDIKTINFGKIKTGERPEAIYSFTNTGNKELDILIVSACDCTELDWTKTTVKPGEKGFVKATFKSDEIEEEDHKKALKKTIDIILKQNDPINGLSNR